MSVNTELQRLRALLAAVPPPSMPAEEARAYLAAAIERVRNAPEPTPEEAEETRARFEERCRKEPAFAVLAHAVLGFTTEGNHG
jgi:hypothetical protein